MKNDKTLILIPTPYAMDRLFAQMQSGGVLETTNIKAIYNLYKTLLQINDTHLQSRTMGVYETLYVLKTACSKYLDDNPNSKFKNLVQKNEFINELYTFYEEITLVYAATSENKINDFLDTEISRLYFKIIACYKSILSDSGVIDENMLYSKLIKSLASGDEMFAEALKQYDRILLKGFDVVNMRYSVLLNAISEGFSIDVKLQLPYSIEILHHFEDAYDTKYIDNKIFKNINICDNSAVVTNTDDTNVHDDVHDNNSSRGNEKASATMSSIFVDYDFYKKLNYDNIHFMAGFGSSNEVKNVCSHVLSLLNDKKIASHSVCIMYDNSELYHTKVIDTCKKMGIGFVERRGEPLWNIALIVMLASILEIFQRSSGGKADVDVDRLTNILSSPYVQIEGINYSSIRSVIYSRGALHLYPVMEYEKLLAKLKYKIDSYKKLLEEINEVNESGESNKNVKGSKSFDSFQNSRKYDESSILEYINTANAIKSFLEKVCSLIEAKTLSDIGLAYLEILKYIKIDEAIKVHGDDIDADIDIDKLSAHKKYLVERDNDALARFIDKINEISFNDDINSILDTDNTLFHFTTILNEMMRKVYTPIYNKDERSVTISTLYDARFHDYEYIFILGMDSSFLSRSASDFFVNDKKRDSINTKFGYPLFISASSLNCDAMALMANIISSSVSKNGHIYLSLPYKDENGTLNLPHNFIEELFYKKTLEEFNFDNLVAHGLVYQEHYVPNTELSTNDDDSIMGFFLHGQKDKHIVIRDKELDVQSIISSIRRRSLENYSDYLGIDNNDNAIYFMKYFLKKSLFATDIINILICPEYFLDTKLFLGNELTKDEIGIQPSDIGIIYHNIFARYYMIVREKFSVNMFNSKNKAACASVLDYVIDDVLNKASVLFDENIADKKFLKDDVYKNAHIFLEKEFARAEADDGLCIPTYLEYLFKDYSIYENGDINIKISGRIDRIDLHYKDKSYKEVDGVRIIDYKSKVDSISDNRGKDVEKINTVHAQLMLYLSYVVGSDNFDFDKERKSISYISYNKLSDKNDDYFSDYSNTENLDYLISNLKDSLKPIFDDISDGKINYNPTKDGCKICRKKDICKSSYYLSGVED